MRPSIRTLAGFCVLAVSVTACATAPNKEEVALVQSMTRNIQSEGRAARDDIERQDILTQATFWAKEYEINPADREAALKLAKLVRTIGNPARAAAIGSQALTLFPTDEELLLVTGQALIEEGRSANAVTYLQAALQQNPTNARVLSALGVAYDQSDRHTLAMQSFRKANAYAPNDPKILSNIGISYALQGKPDMAETWLRRAVALPNADIQSRQNLALILGLQGKFEEAETTASIDMPKTLAMNNIKYVRAMITRPQAWNALRNNEE